MFFYLIINLFFTTKIELSIERAIPFVRCFFFTYCCYFFIKLPEKNLNLFLKFLLVILILQSCAAIFEFAYEQYSQITSWKLKHNISKFEYRAMGFF